MILTSFVLTLFLSNWQSGQLDTTTPKELFRMSATFLLYFSVGNPVRSAIFWTPENYEKIPTSENNL